MASDPHDPADAWSAALRDDPRRARERDLRRYGPRRGRSTWTYWTIAVVGLAVFVVLMRGVMEKTKWTAGASPSTDEPLRTTPTSKGPVRVGCLELVDPYSRTWVDRCGGPRRPLTPAERAELIRAADAAR